MSFRSIFSSLKVPERIFQIWAVRHGYIEFVWGRTVSSSQCWLICSSVMRIRNAVRSILNARTLLFIDIILSSFLLNFVWTTGRGSFPSSQRYRAGCTVSAVFLLQQHARCLGDTLILTALPSFRLLSTFLQKCLISLFKISCSTLRCHGRLLEGHHYLILRGYCWLLRRCELSQACLWLGSQI
jgi:hypothetical protein